MSFPPETFDDWLEYAENNYKRTIPKEEWLKFKEFLEATTANSIQKKYMAAFASDRVSKEKKALFQMKHFGFPKKK